MRSLVQRKSLAQAFCVLLLLAVPATAQFRGATPPKKINPRAVAVLQVLPNNTARLLPVSIFLDGKFYDARYYMAKPVPLALYSDTVYEALPDGMPSGFFTVQNARIAPNIIWGEGTWKPLGAESTSKSAKSDSSKPEEKGPVSTVVFQGTIKETKEEKKQDKREEKQREKEDKQKQKTASTQPPPPISPPKDDDDPDRPVMKKAPSETQVKIDAQDLTPKMPADDPDRPSLSRANPTPQEDKPEELKPPQAGIPGAKYIVAVSDPDPMENRPYDYHWSDSEKATLQQKLSKMAMDALRKFASRDTTAPLAKDAKFSDVQFRAFDLDLSNSPYLVFTGRVDPTLQQAQPARPGTKAPEQLATFYVTLVVRLGSSGEFHVLMSKATDSRHLDLAPRYDLIDAVDANGDNRADLLFRRTNDSGSTFVIYQVTPFQLTQLFEGGQAL